MSCVKKCNRCDNKPIDTKNGNKFNKINRSEKYIHRISICIKGTDIRRFVAYKKISIKNSVADKHSQAKKNHIFLLGSSNGT